jgi:hypothetical protein
MLREAFDESNRDQAMTFEMIEPVVEVESAISSEAMCGGLCSSRRDSFAVERRSEIGLVAVAVAAVVGEARRLSVRGESCEGRA